MKLSCRYTWSRMSKFSERLAFGDMVAAALVAEEIPGGVEP